MVWKQVRNKLSSWIGIKISRRGHCMQYVVSCQFLLFSIRLDWFAVCDPRTKRRLWLSKRRILGAHDAVWLVYCVSALTGVQVTVIFQWYRLLLILWWDRPHSGMTVSEFCYLLGVFPVSQTQVKQVHGHSLRKDVKLFLQSVDSRFWKKSFFGRWNQLVFVALFYNHLWHDLTFLPNNFDSWGFIYLF